VLNRDTYPWGDLNTHIPAQTREDRVPWQNWELFNCKFRVLKSLAYAGKVVNWMDIHRGARFGANCDRIVEEVARKHVVTKNHLNTRSSGFSRDHCSCGRDSDNPVFLYQPASGSPSGDSCLCIRDVHYGYFHEVHQYKHIKKDMTWDQFDLEEYKACGVADLFVLFCTSDVPFDLLLAWNCAVVDKSCWNEYYGPFAARAFFIANIQPPDINRCSTTELQLVYGVGNVYSSAIASKRPFSSYEDAHEKTDVPMQVLKRFRLPQSRDAISTS
jgi:hypothetical protein